MRLKFTAACVMTLAGLIPSVTYAETLKERNVFTIGDILGMGQGWTKDVHNFYGSDGKISRRIDYARSLVTSGENIGDYNIDLSNVVYYFYDENGNLVEERNAKATATSPDNVDKEFIFKVNDHWVYGYENGKLAYKQYQLYREKSDSWTDSYRYAYEYDAAGRVSVEKYWLAYSANKNPNKTTTYTYDGANTKPSKATALGTSAGNCYATDYTYDAEGRLIRTYSESLTTAGEPTGTMKEAVEYTYDGDFCTEVITYDKDNNYSKKTAYVKIDSDANHYMETSYKWNSQALDDEGNPVGRWAANPTSAEHVIQDYAEAAKYVPQISVSKESEEATDIKVRISFADCNSAAYEARIYRDGYIIATLDKDALAAVKGADGWYDVAVDANLKNGDHEYYAMIATGEAGQESDNFIEGYISEPATITVSKNYPAVTGINIQGYTFTREWLPPVDEELEDGTTEHSPGSWSEVYKLKLSWTPLTAEQTEGLGFERYDIYVKKVGGITPIASYTDITTSEATIDWTQSNSELWIVAKYGQNAIESEHVATEFSTLENLTVVEPMPVYGVVYYGGYTPAFVKADLSKPGAVTETIYDLYDDSNADLSYIKGGVSVDDYYYALYSPGDDNMYMGAFDMTNLNFVKLCKADNEYTDMTYDKQSGKIYAVVPGARRSTIYTIDPATGLGTATDMTVPANAYYIAADGQGKIYTLTAADSQYSFYSLDIAEGTYALDTDIVLDGKPYNWSSLYYDEASATLWFTNNKQLWTIRPSDKAVWKEPVSLYRAISGITDRVSTALPAAKAANELTLVAELVDGVYTEYFYDYANNIVREVANDENGVAGYSKYEFDESGRVASVTEFKPVTDKYGVETMAEALTTTYTYDDETGLLSQTATSDGKTATYMFSSSAEYPDAIIYTGENEADNYTAMFQYDDNGNKILEAHMVDMQGGEYLSMEEWAYEDGTNVVSQYKIYDLETYDYKTIVTYTASADDPMLYIASVEGEPVEGIATTRRYADYTESAEAAFMQMFAIKSEEGVNCADVMFSVPEAAYIYDEFSVRVWRDCEMIDELNVQRLGELMSETGILYTDKAVSNGEHEYFLQAVWDDCGYQTTFAQSVEFDTELPAVSGIVFESASEVDGANLVTLRWVNPEYDAEYVFISNNPFIEGETPVAGTVVTDPAVNTVTLDFGDADEANVMIQTRYALGVANSDVTPIVTTSVIGATADALTVTVVNKTVVVNMAADIRVFDASGALVASANGATTLDLSGLTGVYFVTAAKDAAAKVVKARL